MEKSTSMAIFEQIAFLRKLSIEINNCYTDKQAIVESLNSISPVVATTLMRLELTSAK